MLVKKLHCTALIQILERWMACSNIIEIAPDSLVRYASRVISNMFLKGYPLEAKTAPKN